MQKRCVCHIIIVSSFMCSNQVLFLSFSWEYSAQNYIHSLLSICLFVSGL
jgi:hypothetical protein